MSNSNKSPFDSFVLWERASRDTIDVKRAYIDMAGELVAGVMLSQIVFWHLPAPNGESKLRVKRNGHLWLVKKRSDWWEECRLTENQARRSLKLLEDKQLVILQTHQFNGAPHTHIRIDPERFVAAFGDTIRHQTNGATAPNDPSQDTNRMVPEHQTSTETTTEITTETPTGGEPSAQEEPPNGKKQPTVAQYWTDLLYNRLKQRYGITLEPQQYRHHQGRFLRLHQKHDVFEIGEANMERVLTHIVEEFPNRPKIDAVAAYQDVQLGRDTGEAWEKDAPWEGKNEPINPHGKQGTELKDKPYNAMWYVAAYGVQPDLIDKVIDKYKTHTEVVANIGEAYE